MRRFTALYLALDATTKTLAKQLALEAYFRTAPAADACEETTAKAKQLKAKAKQRQAKAKAKQAKEAKAKANPA